MSYCLNPHCPKPHNPDNGNFCQNCRSPLVLKNHYRALKPLGEGGMGRTFLAVDEDRLNAPCALKQLLPAREIQGNSQAMAKATELFEQEARLLLYLGERHSQIPTLLAYFEQDKRWYLVQQLVEGRDLWQELQHEGAFNEAKIRALLLDLLPVLQFIHDHQVVHRDIKPMNIIRRSASAASMAGSVGSGQLVPIDFGVSKRLSAVGLNNTGTRTGTEGYAPIEQLRGGQAFPASDLYSLGVTCIQLLCDRPLNELYDPIASIWRWRSRLWQLNRTVSDDLAYILDKMLEDSIEQRYQSAAEIIDDLTPLSAKKHAPPVAPLMPPPTPAAPPVVPTHNSPPDLSVLPAQNWECLNTLIGHTGAIYSVAIAPDGQTIASASEDKTIKIWDAETGEIRQELTQHSAPVNALAMTPDGKLLISASADKTIKIWQLETGFLLRTLTGHSGAVQAIALSPDGKTIVSGSADKTIKIWHRQTAQLKKTLKGHTQAVISLAISPDGKIIASGSDDRAVKLWQSKNGNLKTTLNGHNASVSAIAISSDGQTLASASGDKTIQTRQLDTGKWLATPKAHSSGFCAIAYAPNPDNFTAAEGHILASGGDDKSVKLWHQESGNLLQVFSGHSDTVSCLAFDPQGRTLVSGSSDKTIKIWGVNS
ncbi:serine/threonine-protein kinase [Phormidium sp. CCY1219]|uniref:serine/threonine-protein kinase n=1 Tax=Phormidium sp. CCY1219 TaxID=2886104 RepID=UPI002D1EF15D|nr:serine/threonine-protein kinase [Phormidium sp. CCY1219]MEB3826574.1 serine/threonine protein kinase [Phormidium sp. CCY1219]